MTDPYTTFDAAYVLGALSPEDRQAFEEHLHGCGRCSASVRELAGLPGLLARADSPETPPDDLFRSLSEPPPADLLPNVLRRVRRGRRLRNAVTLGSAGIAVAACVALGVVASNTPAPALPLTAMSPLGEYPVQAGARLDDQAWGTEVAMTCSYEGGHAGDYDLVAITRDGAVSVLATWQALPEETAHMVVGTRLHRADIQALEIRTPNGLALLRLTP